MSLFSDPFNSLVWYLLAGTRGGPTRAIIVNSLRKVPMNKNQLSKKLNLDYKTVEHHLKILVDNNMLSIINKGKYGAAYTLSTGMINSIASFNEIWDQFGNK